MVVMSCRGPLDILRETWEASFKSDETVVSYVLETQRRLKEMADIAGENMLESQEEQKRCVRTEAVGYMEEDVLEEGVDDIPVWKEEVAAGAKFGDELSAEQLRQVKEVLKECH
ncbi:hypothetical protein EMCRGX_G015544 [Ephydatia muelleri]